MLDKIIYRQGNTYDDVLNSGTTLYAVRHFLEVPLKKFKTAVLVIVTTKISCKADFKGISLSTSLLEHVQVVFFERQQQ
jgi:pyrimidine operon attenuation protein/uracil phosphoribosyltransferase